MKRVTIQKSVRAGRNNNQVTTTAVVIILFIAGMLIAFAVLS